MQTTPNEMQQHIQGENTPDEIQQHNQGVNTPNKIQQTKDNQGANTLLMKSNNKTRSKPRKEQTLLMKSNNITIGVNPPNEIQQHNQGEKHS